MGSGDPDENKTLVRAYFLVRVSFLLQLMAFLLSFIAFFSPFWHVELNTGIQIGLWGRCSNIDLECIWFMERDHAWEQFIPAWHIAAQILFAIGIGILFISCMMAVGNIMFKCCKIRLDVGLSPIIFGIMIFVAMIFQTFSIGTYGIGAYREYECSINSWVAHFEWAFYIGIASLFGCLVASCSYLFAGYEIREEMKGYTIESVYT
jgi:hypothetical protein